MRTLAKVVRTLKEDNPSDERLSIQAHAQQSFNNKFGRNLEAIGYELDWDRGHWTLRGFPKSALGKCALEPTPEEIAAIRSLGDKARLQRGE